MKKVVIILCIFTAVLMPTVGCAGEPTKPDTTTNRLSELKIIVDYLTKQRDDLIVGANMKIAIINQQIKETKAELDSLSKKKEVEK